MKQRCLVIAAAALWPCVAFAQCDTTLPTSCGLNDPTLFRLQQQQQTQQSQQLEQLRQTQQLQQIDRENMHRYQMQQRNPLPTYRLAPTSSSSGIIAGPYKKKLRKKRRKRHRQ